MSDGPTLSVSVDPEPARSSQEHRSPLLVAERDPTPPGWVDVVLLFLLHGLLRLLLGFLLALQLGRLFPLESVGAFLVQLLVLLLDLVLAMVGLATTSGAAFCVDTLADLFIRRG